MKLCRRANRKKGVGRESWVMSTGRPLHKPSTTAGAPEASTPSFHRYLQLIDTFNIQPPTCRADRDPHRIGISRSGQPSWIGLQALQISPKSFAFTVLLGLLAALPALSIDVSAPTLALLPTALGTSATLASLTLSLFMVGFALGQLGGGSLSDRYGRRPLLLVGLSCYTLSFGMESRRSARAGRRRPVCAQLSPLPQSSSTPESGRWNVASSTSNSRGNFVVLPVQIRRVRFLHEVDERSHRRRKLALAGKDHVHAHCRCGPFRQEVDEAPGLDLGSA